MASFTVVTKDGVEIHGQRFGLGKPKILVTSGVHGDEKIGPLLLQALISTLETEETLSGVATLIPVVNPKAYYADSRTHPEDGVDLNRVFLNQPTNSPSSYIVQALAPIITEHELVVDVHAFPKNSSAVVGVFLQEGPEKIRELSLKLLKTTNPQLIWEINYDAAPDKAKGGSLCSLALQNGIPAFGFELPDLGLVGVNQFVSLRYGLLNLIRDICRGYLSEFTNFPPMIRRTMYFNTFAEGIFLPKVEPMQQIAQGELVGTIINLIGNGPGVVEVKAPTDGIVVLISGRRYVKLYATEELFALGTLI